MDEKKSNNGIHVTRHLPNRGSRGPPGDLTQSSQETPIALFSARRCYLRRGGTPPILLADYTGWPLVLRWRSRMLPVLPWRPTLPALQLLGRNIGDALISTPPMCSCFFERAATSFGCREAMFVSGLPWALTVPRLSEGAWLFILRQAANRPALVCTEPQYSLRSCL